MFIKNSETHSITGFACFDMINIANSSLIMKLPFLCSSMTHSIWSLCFILKIVSIIPLTLISNSVFDNSPFHWKALKRMQKIEILLGVRERKTSDRVQKFLMGHIRDIENFWFFLRKIFSEMEVYQKLLFSWGVPQADARLFNWLFAQRPTF